MYNNENTIKNKYTCIPTITPMIKVGDVGVVCWVYQYYRYPSNDTTIRERIRLELLAMAPIQIVSVVNNGYSSDTTRCTPGNKNEDNNVAPTSFLVANTRTIQKKTSNHDNNHLSALWMEDKLLDYDTKNLFLQYDNIPEKKIERLTDADLQQFRMVSMRLPESARQQRLECLQRWL